MKRFAFLALLLATVAAQAAPKSYPLLCRGGDGTIGLSTQGLSGVFYFKKAPGAAGVGLSPGQCSWTDRAIGASEPPCLQQFGVSASAWLFPSKRQNSYVSSQTHGWMRDLLSANKYVTFQVYNPGSGCFRVTKIGP